MSVVAFTPRKPNLSDVRVDVFRAIYQYPLWSITADTADDGLPCVSIQRREGEFATYSAHWDERGWAVLHHGDTLEEVARSPELRLALDRALA